MKPTAQWFDAPDAAGWRFASSAPIKKPHLRGCGFFCGSESIPGPYSAFKASTWIASLISGEKRGKP
jgi:hypothetical protein